jgi:ferredoxin
MTYVITRLCQNCVDGACVDMCPVDAIVEHRPVGRESELPKQLFIDPNQCTGCAACAPECPVEAIFDEDDVPTAFRDDIALNARAFGRPEGFDVALSRLERHRAKRA